MRKRSESIANVKVSLTFETRILKDFSQCRCGRGGGG